MHNVPHIILNAGNSVNFGPDSHLGRFLHDLIISLAVRSLPSQSLPDLNHKNDRRNGVSRWSNERGGWSLRGVKIAISHKRQIERKEYKRLSTMTNLRGSVTRWLYYFFNICPFVTIKMCPIAMKISKEGSTFC